MKIIRTKEYEYKLQWLMPLNPQKEARSKVNKFINLMGAKSFTCVYFRDKDLKIVDSWNNMNQYSTPKKANEALINLVKTIKPDSNIQHIEFFRK